MTPLFIVAGYTLLLFALFFLLRRRFGLLVLAAAATCYVMSMWNFAITAAMSGISVSTFGIPKILIAYSVAIVFVCLVLLPYAHKVGSKIARIVHASFGAIAVAAYTFYSAPQLIYASGSSGVLQQLTPMLPIVVSAMLVLALIDLLLVKKHGHHS